MPRVAYVYAAAALLIASPAIAQQRPCAPIDQVRDRLQSQFGEHLSAAGLDAAGGLVAVYSNPASGSWTITMTRPDGLSCIVSSGEGFAIEMPEPPAKGRTS